MKAILLAGGRGTRISRDIGDQPKCTLEIDKGLPLIRHTVELLINNGIECNVVLGYKKESVKKVLSGLDVNFFYNPFFSVTNSIGSLWFAKELIEKEEVIILNADVYFDQDILDVVLSIEKEQVMLMDSNSQLDYLFKCDGDRLIAHGKNLTDSTAEYVGIAKIRTDFLTLFRSRLEFLIESQNHDLWWENVLYSFIKERKIYTYDVKGLFWSEIDFIEDYKRIVSFRKKG